MKGMWAIALALWCVVVIYEAGPTELESTIAGQDNLQELFESEREGFEMNRERRSTRTYLNGKYQVNCTGDTAKILWTKGSLMGKRMDGRSINCSYFKNNFYVGPGQKNANRTKVNMEIIRILVQSLGCIKKVSINNPEFCDNKMIWDAASIRWTATRTNFDCLRPDSTDCKSVKANVSGTTVQGVGRSCTGDCPTFVAKVQLVPIVDAEASLG